MSHELQILIWGAAVVATVGVNFFDRKNPDALGVALMILMLWVSGRVIGLFYDPPASMQFDSVTDMAAGLVVLAAWWTRRSSWKLATAVLFLVMILNHAAFWLSPRGEDAFLWYLKLRNTLFALQLICVAGPGVRYVGDRVAGALSPWLRRHIDHVPHQGS